ncbi:thioredoxin-like protein [Dendrothele bispora CBS 962.96]|uniref:Thioredoxin-like protein n=1 Tax=Dendrothele bispora (strain CBS 962.96) TaxID=1314807 RepID=A0A4S8MY97_DENBC|nr:thioredoxin-like protein [Dendrothele bispora CBS 962.96]
MSTSKIESLAARLVDPNKPDLKSRNHDSEDEFDDDDALFAELEAEIENGDVGMREQALDAVRREMEKMKELKENYHGSYTEVQDEKELIRITAREPRCVVHFFHSNFKRCEIMDEHLSKLAPKYFNTRFIRVFVENIPWLVEKLGIKILPCVICFVDGVTKDRLVGFEELGNNDAFTTATLELRLAVCGVIQKETKTVDYSVSSRGGRYQADDDDEVFDL